MGWKRLSMKVRFPVDRSSSLEQPFMSNASVPIADLELANALVSDAAIAVI